MKCNNTHCLWNAFESCCHESQEGHEAAAPNELDCPSSLRKDFQESMYQMMDEIDEMMNKRKFRELVDIHKYVRDQRN
ncbi:hypothetical protein B9T62_18860 [Paenibacillus donghaensis]|uniref:Uncharacterized protein n=1 Tax=Paenibacillus donghaensis TaxID=414771 RepID=A0A2Z2KHL2_9BACL|nr:hypothetical protein B9T62_18860 [Paenibacillus donghaensis]